MLDTLRCVRSEEPLERVGVLEYQAVEAIKLEAVSHMARLTGLTKPPTRLPQGDSRQL